jgi:four helix bundle protein
MQKTENKTFDLEERTALFGERIILFCKDIKLTSITKSIIEQLIRSGTSIGANYMEANASSSRKDFRNKIHICKKAQETKHWLRMLSVCLPERKVEIRLLWKECQELVLIFGKIASSLKN